jgi:1,4-alpha-glucan branching enzyme
MSDSACAALLEAREHDPFSVLGLHADGAGWRLRVFRPQAKSVAVVLANGERALLKRRSGSDLFEWHGALPPPLPWRLDIDGVVQYDAYAFPPQPPADDLYLFNAGRLRQAWRTLGAVPETRDGIARRLFPGLGAECGAGFRWWVISTPGTAGCIPWQRSVDRGSGSFSCPNWRAGALYRFELRVRGSGALRLKSDPYAQGFERRPASACCVPQATSHDWRDGNWMQARAKREWLAAPMSVYEMHLGSWMRHADHSFYSYRDLAARLVPYLVELGYTHVEFMPLMEHPLDESWGYQCTGFFAPSSRFGSADDLRFLVDSLHQAGIGVILDWVPGHFPADDWALAHYDGTALYEHEDPKQKMHPDWGTHVFNYGRNEVRSFLLSSACYWMSEFHIDALRVDAVASMIYLDYSRKPGEWTPNVHGRARKPRSHRLPP